jgi:ribosomal protein S18 acetylase RimI-like enzyme
MRDILEKPVAYRRGTAADAREIARLFLMSSDGMAEYIWRKIDPDASDILSVGEMRYARKDADFGYGNCLMADTAGEIAGMVHGYSMADDPGEPDTDPVLRPYSELEHPGSFYIAGLAVHDRHRRSGIGRDLMKLAEVQARKLGHKAISLICFTENKAAMSLYEALGYRETDRRAIVPCPLLKYEEGEAALLVKNLDPATG